MKSGLSLKTKNPLSFLVIAIVLATIASFIQSCSKEKATSALLMAVNASQPATSQDFYVDGAKLNTAALTYGKSTGYLQVTANNIHQAAFKNNPADTIDATISVAITPGTHYSVYYGDSNSINLYPNDLTTPQSNNARVRFINLSAGVNTGVDFAGIVAGKDSVLVSGATYATASTYYQISTLSNTFTLALTGTTPVLLNMPAVLQAGKIYSIVTSGTSSATLTYSLISEN